MIAVLGLGFVGLTVAVGFADKGVCVYGIDIDDFKTDLIRRGKIPYYEPGLDDALARNLNENLYVIGDIDDAPDGIDLFFICTGSPRMVDGSLDYSTILGAIENVLDAGFEDYFVLAIKTTLPPGSMDEVIVPFLEEKGVKLGEDMGVAFAPELFREGKCWDDFTNPSRIVLGSESERDIEILKRYYKVFDAPIMPVSMKTAEFVCYMSSTLLATMISYSNEMAQAAKAMGGIDIPGAFQILQMDSRWSHNTMRGYVYPGCGFGGTRLPKDTADFATIARRHGARTDLLESVIRVNDLITPKICAEIASQASPDQKLGILGLTFKEGSGDVRNSASAKIIDGLLARGFDKIYAYDPIANDDYAVLYKQNIRYCFSLREICEVCEVLVIATPWRQFKTVLYYAKDKTIIDCRYMLESCETDRVL